MKKKKKKTKVDNELRAKIVEKNLTNCYRAKIKYQSERELRQSKSCASDQWAKAHNMWELLSRQHHHQALNILNAFKKEFQRFFVVNISFFES